MSADAFPLELSSDGIIVVKPYQSINYLNASRVKSMIVELAHILTYSTKVVNGLEIQTDWTKLMYNDIEGSRKEFLEKLYLSRRHHSIFSKTQLTQEEVIKHEQNKKTEELPLLRAVIINMSAVSFIDTSGVQMLQDLKKELLEYSRKQRVLFSNHSAADDGKRLAEGVTKDKAELTPRKTLSDIDDFELHFASVKPDVLRVLELTGLSKVILDYKAELRLSETASIEQLTPLGYSTPQNDAKNANAFFTDPQNGDAGTSDMYTTNRPLKIEASELVESMFLNYPIGRPAHTRHLSEYELVSDNVHDSVDSAIAYIKFNNV